MMQKFFQWLWCQENNVIFLLSFKGTAENRNQKSVFASIQAFVRRPCSDGMRESPASVAVCKVGIIKLKAANNIIER